MEQLIKLETFILLGFFCACLEMAFQKFMEPNNILFPYGVLLMRISQKGEIWRHIARPLGRCRYCNSMWLTFYVYVYFYGYELPVLLAAGTTCLFVKFLSDVAFPEVDANGKIEKHFNVEIEGETPVKPMLISYSILGTFYFILYTFIL